MVDATRDAPPESLETTVGAIAGFAGGIVTYLLFSLYPVLLLVLSVLGWRMQQRETPGPTERPM